MDDVGIYALFKWLAGTAFALGIAIIGYFVREDWKSMKQRMDKHSERLSNVERCLITREELTRIMAGLHGENKETLRDNKETMKEMRQLLERMNTKIDENDRRETQTRHDIRETVHGILADVALIKRFTPIPKFGDDNRD